MSSSGLGRPIIWSDPIRVNYAPAVGRYSSVRGRELTRYEQAVERCASSRAGAWLFLHVINRVDRHLLPLTRGRASVAVGAPVGVLETIGACSGARRLTPLLYFGDGDAVIVVASNGGHAYDPVWLHNLRAHPEVRFLSRATGWRAYHAQIATGTERDRRWLYVTDFYAGYEAYARRAHPREIPIVLLTPRRPP
jgi:deazaflavin-dependent oxidoreductase (nitroreductase family)